MLWELAARGSGRRRPYLGSPSSLTHSSHNVFAIHVAHYCDLIQYHIYVYAPYPCHVTLTISVLKMLIKLFLLRKC